MYISSILVHIALLFYTVCLPRKQLPNRHRLTLEIMRFLTSMSLTRNLRSDLLPNIIKVLSLSWDYLVIADDVSYLATQLPNFQLGLQTHFAQLILLTVRHPNQLLLISPTSSLVRLGNQLDIVLFASECLFLWINCFVMTPVILELLLMPSTTLLIGWPHEHIHIQLQLRTLVSKAILTNSTRQNTSNLPKNEAGPWCCPLSNGNWPWSLLCTKKPMFSVEGVTQRLVRFIAANDQVNFSCLSPILLLIILLGLVFKHCQEH
jgi:hypothetical protein